MKRSRSPLPGPEGGSSGRDPRSRRLCDVRSWGFAALERAGIESWAVDADALLCHALGLDRVGLVKNRDSLVSGERIGALGGMLQRRRSREPVAYIVGAKEFFGLDLYVDSRVLVVRPTTELLVERALQTLGVAVPKGRAPKPDPRPAPFVVEVGTGCGAVCVALATYLPSARFLATDVSHAALIVAKENVSRYDLGGRVLLAVADLQPATEPPPDLLIANLPYISSGEIELLDPDVRDYEPRLALDGGIDGFELHRRLIASARLRPGGVLLLEIGCDQGEAVVAAAGARDPALRVEVTADLGGLDRIATLSGWQGRDLDGGVRHL